MSGEWSGAMGNVVNGKYSVALSTWYTFYERDAVLDLDVMIQWDFSVAAIVLKPPKIDHNLFIRPFSSPAWIVIFATFIIQFSINYLSSILTKKHLIRNVSFGKIWTLVSWFTFVLINAFYSGALTMFFSTQPIMPFDSIEGVLNAVPSWNLLMLDGTNAWFENKADRVIIISSLIFLFWAHC